MQAHSIHTCVCACVCVCVCSYNCKEVTLLEPPTTLCNVCSQIYSLVRKNQEIGRIIRRAAGTSPEDGFNYSIQCNLSLHVPTLHVTWCYGVPKQAPNCLDGCTNGHTLDLFHLFASTVICGPRPSVAAILSSYFHLHFQTHSESGQS